MAAGSIASARLSASIAVVAQGSIGITGLVQVSTSALYSKPIATGTGANQATLEYGNDFQIAAGGAATASIDLSGALKDALGNDVLMANVRGLVILNRSDEFTHPTSNISITGNFITGATLGVITSLLLRPGGAWCLFDPVTGFTVTAGTADIITLTNLSVTEAADVRVMVLGK